MAAKKKSRTGINLLPQNEFESSLTGRILRWILTTFRVLVILVEGVVISGFFTRFYLDTRITDLDDEIEQKQIIIASYSNFEKEFKNTQKRLESFTFASSTENDPFSLITKVSSKLPEDVFLTEITFTKDANIISASSLTEQSIAQFIANLRTDSKFSNIHLLQLHTQKGLPLVDFSLTTQKEGGS